MKEEKQVLELEFDSYQVEESRPETPFILGVYGTLKKNHGAHGFITRNNGIELGIGKFKNLQMYDLGGFPCVSEGNNVVEMELYELPAQSITRFDSYEGVPSLYNRVKAGEISGKPVYFYMFARKVDEKYAPKVNKWRE